MLALTLSLLMIVWCGYLASRVRNRPVVLVLGIVMGVNLYEVMYLLSVMFGAS